NLVLAVCTLIILQTISTWLAVIVAMIPVLILQWRQFGKIRSWSRIATMKILVTGIISLGLVFFVYSRTNNFRLLKNKIAITAHYLSDSTPLYSGVDQKDNSIYERLLAWRNSLLMIKEY